MEFPILGTISGPCWDPVWANFTSKPARALKFSRLHQYGLRPISMENLLFETILGPCWTMLGPCLAQLHFQISYNTVILKTESTCSIFYVFGMYILKDHVGDHV